MQLDTQFFFLHQNTNFKVVCHSKRSHISDLKTSIIISCNYNVSSLFKSQMQRILLIDIKLWMTMTAAAATSQWEKLRKTMHICTHFSSHSPMMMMRRLSKHMSKQEGNIWLSSIEINFLSHSLPVVLALNLNEIYFIRVIIFMKFCVVNSPLGITILLLCDLEDDGIGALGANSCGASSIKLVVQILSFVAKVPTECRRWWPSDLVSEFWDKLKNLWSLWNVCGLNLMAQFVK